MPGMDYLEERRGERSTRLHCQANASVSVGQIDAPERRPWQEPTECRGECRFSRANHKRELQVVMSESGGAAQGCEPCVFGCSRASGWR